jgi:hypothetical protein
MVSASIEPLNPKQFVTGALDTFIFGFTDEDYTSEGGIELALPKGYVAVTGMAELSATPTAEVAAVQVVVSNGVAKLKAFSQSEGVDDAANTPVWAEVVVPDEPGESDPYIKVSAHAVVFAKKG